jgi:hypothetical protein
MIYPCSVSDRQLVPLVWSMLIPDPKTNAKGFPIGSFIISNPLSNYVI